MRLDVERGGGRQQPPLAHADGGRANRARPPQIVKAILSSESAQIDAGELIPTSAVSSLSFALAAGLKEINILAFLEQNARSVRYACRTI